MRPPIGVMALSISAAVVPGAKFSAITTEGPARPRMDMPLEVLGLLTMLNWLLKAGDEAEPLRALYKRTSRAGPPAREPRLLVSLPRGAAEELES